MESLDQCVVLLSQQLDEFHEEQGKLRHRWEMAKTEWDDPVSQEFAGKVMMPLFDQVRLVQREMDNLLHVFEQIRRNAR